MDKAFIRFEFSVQRQLLKMWMANDLYVSRVSITRSRCVENRYWDWRRLNESFYRFRSLSFSLCLRFFTFTETKTKLLRKPSTFLTSTLSLSSPLASCASFSYASKPKAHGCETIAISWNANRTLSQQTVEDFRLDSKKKTQLFTSDWILGTNNRRPDTHYNVSHYCMTKYTSMCLCVRVCDRLSWYTSFSIIFHLPCSSAALCRSIDERNIEADSELKVEAPITDEIKENNIFATNLYVCVYEFLSFPSGQTLCRNWEMGRRTVFRRCGHGCGSPTYIWPWTAFRCEYIRSIGMRAVYIPVLRHVLWIRKKIVRKADSWPITWNMLACTRRDDLTLTDSYMGDEVLHASEYFATFTAWAVIVYVNIGTVLHIQRNSLFTWIIFDPLALHCLHIWLMSHIPIEGTRRCPVRGVVVRRKIRLMRQGIVRIVVGRWWHDGCGRWWRRYARCGRCGAADSHTHLMLVESVKLCVMHWMRMSMIKGLEHQRVGCAGSRVAGDRGRREILLIAFQQIIATVCWIRCRCRCRRSVSTETARCLVAVMVRRGAADGIVYVIVIGTAATSAAIIAAAVAALLQHIVRRRHFQSVRRQMRVMVMNHRVGWLHERVHHHFFFFFFQQRQIKLSVLSSNCFHSHKSPIHTRTFHYFCDEPNRIQCFTLSSARSTQTILCDSFVFGWIFRFRFYVAWIKRRNCVSQTQHTWTHRTAHVRPAIRRRFYFTKRSRTFSRKSFSFSHSIDTH